MQADYKAAYALLSPSQKRYDDAAKAFTAFLERYPGSTLAANAQYWLAEAYYVSQKNDQALEAFTQVVEQAAPGRDTVLPVVGREHAPALMRFLEEHDVTLKEGPADAETAVLPSSVIATPLTHPECPSRVCRSSPV